MLQGQSINLHGARAKQNVGILAMLKASAYNNDNDLGYGEVVTKLLTRECEAYGICLVARCSDWLNHLWGGKEPSGISDEIRK